MLLPVRSNHQVQPITVAIKNILEQYPGKVTILRELLQNADDAGATIVRFVLDDRDHPTSNLIHEHLAQFHGPALLAFNNAKFTDEDFDNIAKTGASYKKNDASTTGRFGLGFNSVYHWTDTPSIVSQDKLVILDPHARDWSRELVPGTSKVIGPSPMYNFVEAATEPSMQGQMAAFRAIMTDTTTKFDGTIIRIPLRTREQGIVSDIKPNHQTTSADIREALQSFVIDFGSNGLLFMRNLEQIVIESTLGKTVTMRITNSSEVRSARILIKQSLRSAMNNPHDMFAQSFKVAIEYVSGNKSKQTVFAVQHLISGLSVKCGQESLHSDAKSWATSMMLVPWVAIAAQIPCSDMVKGTMYTVLPLPIPTQQDVHTHGQFGITSDRARLYSKDDKDKPEPGLWNEFLLEHLAPNAWAQLLVFISKEPGLSTLEWWPKFNPGGPLANSSSRIVKVITRSRLAVFPTVIGYVSHDVAYLHAGNELFDLREALAEARVPVLYTERDIRPCIQSLFAERTLSPVRLCKYLQNQNQHIRDWSQGTKKIILEYLLSGSKVTQSIFNLELFPFEDGSYQSIPSDGAFIHRDELDRDLFLLDKSHNLDVRCVTRSTGKILVNLCKAPNQKESLVRYRSATDMKIFLLRFVFHEIYGYVDSATLSETAASFVPKVWKWISRNIAPANQQSTLSGEFTGLWLLPLNDGKFRKLTDGRYFQQEIMFVGTGEMAKLLKTLGSNPLSKSCSLLSPEKMGLKDSETSSLVQRLLQDNFSILDFGNMADVAQWLANNSHLVSRASDEEKRVILKHLAQSMSDQEFSKSQTALQSLDIFEKVSWEPNAVKLSRSWTTLNTSRVSIGLLDGPIPIPAIVDCQFLIANRGSETSMLLTKFRLATCLDSRAIVERHVLPNIGSSPSTMQVKVEVAKMLLRGWSHVPEFQEKIRGIAMVPVATISNQAIQKLLRPVDLIDPSATSLKELFFDNDEVLPEARFFQELGSVLKLCGMKCELEKVLVLQRVKCYAASNKPISEIQRRVYIMLESDCRWSPKSPAKDFVDLRNLAWLPVLVDGVLVLKAPKDCRGIEDQLIAGFKKPILELEISKAWKTRLGWDSKLPNEVLLAQLDKGLEFGDRAVVDAVLLHLAAKGQVSVLKQELKTRPFILTSKGHSLPASQVFLSGCENLTPYLGNVDTRFWNDHKVLLELLGVKETAPQAEDLAAVQAILEGLVPLKDLNDIATAVELLTQRSTIENIALLELQVLCEDGTFCTAKDITYPNAEGVVGDYKLTHPHISPQLARTLGLQMLSEHYMKGLQNIANADYDEEYDQKERPTTGISNTLDLYPVTSTFNEYLANADDAKSSSISWLLDERHHTRDRLLTPELKVGQGPALLVHNNSIFEESDWKGFKNLGEGSKQQNSASIGQFGFGSQTMYHWTDTPMVLSGKWLLILDPQERVLLMTQGGRRRMRGVKFELKDLRGPCPGQLAPFSGLWNYSTDLDCYNGTIFRFPLRQQEMTSELRIQEQYVDASSARQLISSYFKEARISLLFLRHIQSIDFSVYGNQRAEWSITRNAALPPTDLPLKSSWVISSFETVDSQGSRISGTDKWRVTTEVPKKSSIALKFSRRTAKNSECGIAALVSSTPELGTTTEGLSKLSPKEPCLFSTLPLPIASNLPVYLHATFSLSGDRRSLHIDGHGDQSNVKLNKSLLEERLSVLYLLFLEDLGSNDPENALKFWPVDQPLETSCSTGLFSAFWMKLPFSKERLYPKVSIAEDGGTGSVEHSTLKDAVLNFYNDKDTKRLEPLLVTAGVNLIQPLPLGIIERLENSSRAIRLTQGMLRELFSKSENKAPLENAISKDSSVMDTLLKFALETSEIPLQLNGCYFLQLADGKLGTLKLQSSVKQIDYYEASNEEITLFSFASSVLVSSSKFRIVKTSLEGTASNVARLQPIHVQKLFSMKNSHEMSIEWLTNFWLYWKRSTNTSEAMLEDLPVHLARNKEGEHYVKGAELRTQAAVVAPNEAAHQKLCAKFPELWIFDSAFMPPSLAGKETSFSEPASFFRFIRALIILCPTNIDFGRFVKTYLDSDDIKVLRGLVVQYAGRKFSCEGFSTREFESVKTHLKLIELWPSSGEDSKSHLLVSAEGCLLVAPDLRDTMLVPWMMSREKFVQSSKYYACLQQLGVKEVSLENLIQKYQILTLPKLNTDSNWAAYKLMIGTIHRKCAEKNHSGIQTIYLLGRKIAVNNEHRVRDARELYDHDDPIFVAAFRQNHKGKFIHDELRQHRDLWIKLGMHHNDRGRIKAESYCECLKELERRNRPEELLPNNDLKDHTVIVLEPLITLSSRTSDIKDEEWMEIGEYAVFHSRTDMSEELLHRRETMMDVALSNPVLSLDEIVSETHTAICWTQVAFPVHNPSVEVLRQFGNSQPSTGMVWKHLLCLKELAATLDHRHLNGFLVDLQQTYKYLQDNYTPYNIPDEAKTEPVWLNLKSFDGNIETLTDVRFEWMKARNLVLSTTSDSGSIKAVKNGLRRFDVLLKSMGCKLMFHPTVNAPVVLGNDDNSTTMEFRKMRVDGDLIDIMYMTEGHIIKAHRQLLATASSFCKAHFKSGMQIDNVIEYQKYDRDGNEDVTFISYYALSTMIMYAYKDPNIDWDAVVADETDDDQAKDRKLGMLLDLLKGADFWMMKNLVSTVEAKILGQGLIRVSNVNRVLEDAMDYNAPSVEEYCTRFIENNQELMNDAGAFDEED